MALRVSGFVLSAVFLVPTIGLTVEPSLPQLTKFNLHADQLPLAKILDNLKDKTGIRVENQPGEGERKLSLDLKGTTFWQAVDALASAAQARVSILPTQKRIVLVKRPAQGKLFVSHSGPFRVALKRISVSRDLESGSHKATGFFEVAWEPALQPLYLETVPQNLVVKDDKGTPLPRLDLGSSLAPVDGRIALLFEVPLPAPARATPNLGSMEGQLSAITPIRMLPFRFASLDQLAKAPVNAAMRQQTQDGITCRISKVTLANEFWNVQVTVDTPPGASRLESYQSWLSNNELVLVSPDGKRQLTRSSEAPGQTTGQRVVWNYTFTDREGQPRGKPEDWKVQYTSPAGVVVLPIPFRFTEVPLP